MRWKIIIVNGGIVLLVGILSFGLLFTTLGDVVANPRQAQSDAERAIRAANAVLELDALRSERWLNEKALTEEVQSVFQAGTERARNEGATEQANTIHGAASNDPLFAKMAPALVLFVDKSGTALGRNGSNLMRGDKTGEAYDSLMKAIKSGRTMSAMWLSREREEQLLVSYAPVRGEGGEVLGALVMGTPLNDERLSRTSEMTSDRQLVLGVPATDKLEVVAKSANAQGEVVAAANDATVAQGAIATMKSGNATVLDGAPEGLLLAAAPLMGYSETPTVILAAVPSSLVPSVAGLLWPVLAVAGFALVLVVVGGMLLGNYISRPVEEIEDGLLQIINGKANLRFELEHPELGGLVTRINSLLNAFMDVAETDEAGRPSRPPSAAGYDG